MMETEREKESSSGQVQILKIKLHVGSLEITKNFEPRSLKHYSD